MRWRQFLLILMVAFLWTAPAQAGNGGFFTTYNSKVDRGEFELMLMNDFTRPSRVRREDDGFGNYFSHMLELEVGVTDQYATEIMIETYEDLASRKAQFTGFRWENRFRIFRDPVFLNPMIYVEYEDLDPGTRYKMEVSGWVRPPYATEEGPERRERILEGRLVLSDDFGPLGFAANLISETDLRSGLTAFGYAMGVMWMMHGGDSGGEEAAQPGASYGCPMHPEVHQEAPGSCPRCGMELRIGHFPIRREACGCKRDMPNCSCGHCAGGHGPCHCGHAGGIGLGLEMYGGVGDTRSFGLKPSRQEHYVGPIFMVHFDTHWMAHAQVAIGLTTASDDLVRLNVGYEF